MNADFEKNDGNLKPARIVCLFRYLHHNVSVQHFFIPGQPIGYYASSSTPNYTRMKQYHAYRDKVRLYAQTSAIRTPLFADRERPLYVFTSAVFSLNIKSANGRPMVQHSDPSNVQKGIVDALFLGGGGDRHTGGGFESPKYSDDDNEVGCFVTLIRPESLVALGGVRKKLKEQTPYLPGMSSPLRPKKKRWNRWKKN